MSEQEWQELLARQNKRMRKKGYRSGVRSQPTGNSPSKLAIDPSLQRFVLNSSQPAK